MTHAQAIAFEQDRADRLALSAAQVETEAQRRAVAVARTPLADAERQVRRQRAAVRRWAAAACRALDLAPVVDDAEAARGLVATDADLYRALSAVNVAREVRRRERRRALGLSETPHTAWRAQIRFTGHDELRKAARTLWTAYLDTLILRRAIERAGEVS